MNRRRVPALITAVLLAACYAAFAFRFQGEGARALLTRHAAQLLYLVPIAAIAQLIKAARSYVVFVDTELSFADNLLYHCQTTIVSVIVPYKLGELFRIYRYGSAIGDYLGGAARILIDRLVDTAALLVFLTGMLLLGSHSVFSLYVLLVAFTLLACAAWFAFPSVYRFWNDYLITRRHSARAHKALLFMQRIERAYRYLRELLRGKLFLMFLMSFAAWGLELLGIVLLVRHAGADSGQIALYLQSALSSGTNEHQVLYAILYVAVLTGGMLALLLARAVKNGKERT